jgi:hypothetical protein
MAVTEKQRKEITQIQRAIEGAKGSAEISAATVSVLLAGASSMFGVPLTPEMIAAGSALLAGIGNRISRSIGQ